MRDTKSLIGPRIIAGSRKGIELLVPSSARPITGRIKQSIFDSIAEVVEGSSVLDLFAGAGNMGIEALSRGARSATFVDSSDEAIEVIKKNLIRTRFSEVGNVTRRYADKFLKDCREKYDIIFLDPPFDTAEDVPIHLLLKVMGGNSVAVWRKPTSQSVEYLPKSLDVVSRDRFGSSEVVYLVSKSNR